MDLYNYKGEKLGLDEGSLMTPQRLATGTNLNTVRDPGVYTIYGNYSYSNMPTNANEHGILEVWHEDYGDNQGRIYQRLTYSYRAGKTRNQIWIRGYTVSSSTWDRWVSTVNTFDSNISFTYSRLHDTNYTMFRIFKTKIDGTNQYPFVRMFPNTSEGKRTAYELATSEGWDFVINGGGWEGPAIQNSAVYRDANPYYQTKGYILTIDQNGDLGFKEDGQAGDAAALVQQGIVSAFYSFFPLIVNYENYDYPTDIKDTDNHNWEIAQKQIIGQFGNGDYFVLTSEGREFDNSVGFTVQQVQALCKSLGLKFAFELDGGGSTQTILGSKRVNHCFYDDNGTTERVVPGFIVFNGTNTFNIPTQN